ncbi:alpha/beta hydrolase [Streptomyces sp. MJP52]|uniref:alpha/beta hydrolase family protein n=1 Tax=Streptomyces sp. MJP52 TaxID=2940555 RepID=UPI00247587F1|nr:alpha/beta hydrolase [Streptomyces sp. MJP52]MDH6225842.1 acetyl esterase/lipase [Streptomyces sp. MJP52]
MTDEERTAAARERAAAEERSVFSHEPVAPDATRAYGDHPDQVVDFYAPPAGPAPAPLVVVVHGGAWRAPYDRLHVTPFARFLARRGFAVAVPEYRRGGAAQGEAGRWPQTLDDVAAALDALPRLAAEALGGRADTGRTVLTGHSAGGHLVLWAAARHLLPEGSPWRAAAPPRIRGVVALAPIADLGAAEKLEVCGHAALQFLGGPDLFEERRPHADPVLLVPTGIATAVVQGGEDADVPPPVAESYARAAALAGEVVGVTLLEGVGHFPLIDPAADACAVVAEEIAQLAW